MIRFSIALVIVLLTAGRTWADYPADREAAVALVKADKQAEALAAFLQLADSAVSDIQKTDALEQATMCAHRLKRHDRAMELAERIPHAAVSKTVQMRLMLANQKALALIERFKGEGMRQWPTAIAGEARYYRGQAYVELEQGEPAASDLARAVEALPAGKTLTTAALALGDVCRNQLADKARALKAYRLAGRIEKERDAHGWRYYNAVISAAGILRAQEKYDHALKTLEQARPSQRTAYWGAALRAAKAELLAAQGKTDEAIAKLSEALTINGITEYQKSQYEKRIEALQAAR